MCLVFHYIFLKHEAMHFLRSGVGVGSGVTIAPVVVIFGGMAVVYERVVPVTVNILKSHFTQ